ncbi:MAG: CDP-alcohol phosphatidyltransferase family protein [Candidatus Omnitrophica bacterium]|nr:CDP-alcohol phosphatidyltransferase family protein [Candidatus Omnitrophota bacterium]MBI2174535.1 CDP-alcohol phosphatidyltransferase family protein [Candidatus Omnitrophota bacterium]MBI3009380.1 CDP-alcohol phosphatidyltransferase family protein [Candidatus Omnitrophota bacterium]
MITSRYKATFERILKPVARVLVSFGIGPSTLTISGLVLSILVCLWFVKSRAVVAFCILILAVSLLDGLDGAVARLSGRVTKFGGYLDALCDRYAEASVVLTAAWFSGYWILSMILLIGVMQISYAKARAAMEVTVSNLEWPDLMERMERGVIFVVGLALGSLIHWKPLGRDLFWWTLVILSVLAHATVLQRVWRAKGFIQKRDP